MNEPTSLKPFGIGVKVRRFFSWSNPNADRPVRVIRAMFMYEKMKPTTDGNLCSYLKFEDSETVDTRHQYGVVD